MIVGPVLPHEVVGFSGGNKYLFPGLSGQELIDLTHWLGALITSAEIIGTRGITPVRALDRRGRRPGARRAARLCVVVDRAHRRPRSAPPSATPGGRGRRPPTSPPRPTSCTSTRRSGGSLSLVAPRYADLWTGAKGFYKVEPIVADGGEVILYAPHITEIAPMHPGARRLGYHCRDYFLAQWDRFRHHPAGELAHSTHLFGAGTYDPVDGRAASGCGSPSPPASPRRSCAGRTSPTSTRPPSTSPRGADPDTLVVPDAGEVLYRLR